MKKPVRKKKVRKSPIPLFGDSRERDPFLVIGKRPKGFSYQWVAVKILGQEELAADILTQMKLAGWKPVPAKRHPKMRKDKSGHISVGGQILMERTEFATKKAREKEIKSAKDMHDSQTVGGRTAGCSFPIREFTDSKPYDHAKELAAAKEEITKNGGGVKITVELPVQLTDREIDASCFLRLGPTEYARRKFLMMAETESRVLVMRSTGFFEFASMKVHSEKDA